MKTHIPGDTYSYHRRFPAGDYLLVSPLETRIPQVGIVPVESCSD